MMLSQKFIEPAQMEWTAPIIFAMKKDRMLRFCVDYRKLNAVTKLDSYLIPRMDKCNAFLGNAAIFSTSDANSGYWQVEIEEADRDKTAFNLHHRLHRFVCMSSGLRNASGTFQRTMDVISSTVRLQFVLVHKHGIVISSKSSQAHIGYVHNVLTLFCKRRRNTQTKEVPNFHREDRLSRTRYSSSTFQDSNPYNKRYQWIATSHQSHETPFLPRTVKRLSTICSKLCFHGGVSERKTAKRLTKIFRTSQQQVAEVHQFAKRCAHFTTRYGNTELHQTYHSEHKRMSCPGWMPVVSGTTQQHSKTHWILITIID